MGENDTIFPGYNYEDYYIYGINTSILEILRQHEQEISGTGVYAIILCILSFLANFIIVLAVLCCSELRRHVMYLQVVNFSLANIGNSVFVLPITVYLEMNLWNLGVTACHVYIFVDVLLPFICMIILLLMNLDRLLLMRCEHSMNFYKSFPAAPRALTQPLLVLLPWIIGTSIIVPMWKYGGLAGQEHPGFCYYTLHNDAAVASALVSYFVPAMMIIVMITYVLILTVRGRLEDAPYTHSHTTDYSSPRHVSTVTFEFCRHVPLMTVCLADLCFIAMWFPYQLFQILMTNCQGCHPPLSAINAFMWMGATTSFVLPVSWLSDENIRNRVVSAIKDALIYVTKVCCACVLNSQENPSERNGVPLMEWSTATTTTVCIPESTCKCETAHIEEAA